jgi:hypothetical protein
MYVIYSERKTKAAGEPRYWDGRKYKWVSLENAQQYASNIGLAPVLDGVWVKVGVEDEVHAD